METRTHAGEHTAAAAPSGLCVEGASLRAVDTPSAEGGSAADAAPHHPPPPRAFIHTKHVTSPAVPSSRAALGLGSVLSVALGSV